MTLLVFIVLGAAIGWLASIGFRHDSLRASLANIALGALGSLGGMLASEGGFDAPVASVDSLLLGAGCALVVVGIAALIRKQTNR